MFSASPLCVSLGVCVWGLCVFGGVQRHVFTLQTSSPSPEFLITHYMFIYGPAAVRQVPYTGLREMREERGGKEPLGTSRMQVSRKVFPHRLGTSTTSLHMLESLHCHDIFIVEYRDDMFDFFLLFVFLFLFLFYE